MTDKLGLNDYQQRSRATAFFPRIRIVINDNAPIDAPWLYPLLGMLGEAGELAEKFKKLLRDDHGLYPPDFQTTVIKETGDVLWYQARIADAMETTLNDIAAANIQKLESRQARGKLSGSGDDR